MARPNKGMKLSERGYVGGEPPHGLASWSRVLQLVPSFGTTKAMTTSDVIKALEKFSPAEEEVETLDRLYDILGGLEEAQDRAEAFPTLFGVLERFPDAHLGTPGPIVYALESIPGYEPFLAESVRRQPTYYTVWMINRILNVEDTGPARTEWLQLMESAGRHPRAPYGLAEKVAHFLEFQESGECSLSNRDLSKVRLECRLRFGGRHDSYDGGLLSCARYQQHSSFRLVGPV